MPGIAGSVRGLGACRGLPVSQPAIQLGRVHAGEFGRFARWRQGPTAGRYGSWTSVFLQGLCNDKEGFRQATAGARTLWPRVRTAPEACATRFLVQYGAQSGVLPPKSVAKMIPEYWEPPTR